MTLCRTKDVITYGVVLANQKTEYFVNRWFRALAMFDVTPFPGAFVGASDVKRSVDTLITLIPWRLLILLSW